MNTIVKMKMRNGDVNEIDTSPEKMKKISKKLKIPELMVGARFSGKCHDNDGKVVGVGAGYYNMGKIAVILDGDKGLVSFDLPYGTIFL